MVSLKEILNTSVKDRAYTNLVRPKLEYCSTIWNPHTTSNINKLESVQKNAARFVLNKPHGYKKPDSTTKMVKDLNWGKLEQRRKRSDVAFMHKVVQVVIKAIIFRQTRNFLPLFKREQG